MSAVAATRSVAQPTPASTTTRAPRPASTGPQLVPGYDANDKPLPDDQIWPKVGRQAPNTANGLSETEMRKLGEMAMKKPKEFFQRLHADSSNGTPVKYGKTFKVGRSGEVQVSMNVNKGKMKMEVEFKPYKKRVRSSSVSDWFVSRQIQGEGPSVTLGFAGQIGKDGSVDKVKVNVHADNLPAFATDKIAGKPEAMKRAREAIKRFDGKRNQRKYVMKAMERVFDSPEKFVPALIGAVASSSSQLRANFSTPTNAMRVRALFGGGKFKFNLAHIFSGSRHTPDDLDVRGTVSGNVKDFGKTVELDKVRVETAKPIKMTWGDNDSIDDGTIHTNGRAVKKSDLQGVAMLAFAAASSL